MKKLSTLTILSFYAAFTIQSKAQSIVPDSTFNNFGNRVFTFYNNIDRGFACAIQNDQKMVMVGLSKNPSTGFFENCVARFNMDGTLDTSFSGDGKAYIAMGNQGSIGGITPALKIDANQKIVIAGSGRGVGSQDFLVARLNSNGTPDNTFNGTGSIFVDITGANTQPDAASALAFDAAGKIYVTGVVGIAPPFDNELAVVRLTTSGTLDLSFDTDGKKYFNPASGNEFGDGIGILSNGNVVMGMSAASGMSLLCMDPSGNLVSGFGTNGYVSLGLSGSSMSGLAIDNAGRIVVCGTASSDIAVARYLSNGAADLTFGTQGKFLGDVNGLADAANALCIAPDNKILIAGQAETAISGDNFLIARIDTNGTFDNSFNSTGYFQKGYASGTINEACNGIALMNDGRVMVAGTIEISSAVNEDICVFRVKSTSPLGVSDNIETDEFKLFPNPAISAITLNVQDDGLYDLINIKGQQIKQVHLKKGNNNIPVADLMPGQYIIRNLKAGVSKQFVKTNQ